MRCYYIFFLAIIGLIASCTLTETDSDSQKKSDEKTREAQHEKLSSWAEGPRSEILNWVEAVTNEGSADFIPVSDRIAVFDNDGTLWSEKPAYFQILFVMDRIKEMAQDHPEWKNEQPFKAALENDMQILHEQGMEGLMTLLMATHAGMTNKEFNEAVHDWLSTSKHPARQRPYTELVYQPMLELIQYLTKNDFKVFIVSGGGIDFMRVWVEDVYGIPKSQVIGSTIKKEYSFEDGVPVIKRLAQIDHIDDKEGKPESIDKFIGRKPVFSAGNSDGDLQMMRYTDSNTYPSFKLYIHHTDSIREWAYDRNSSIGRFDKALDEAREKNWLVVDMKEDFEEIFSFENK